VSNFLADGVLAIPAVKADVRSPTGASTEINSTDLNQIRQALIDLRAAIINSWGGTSAPEVTGTGNDALVSLIFAMEAVGIITNKTPYQLVKDSVVASDALYVARG
jgi:hypothetical protein